MTRDELRAEWRRAMARYADLVDFMPPRSPSIERELALLDQVSVAGGEWDHWVRESDRWRIAVASRATDEVERVYADLEREAREKLTAADAKLVDALRAWRELAA